MSPRIFVVTVAWNDTDFLPELLTSLVPAPSPDVQALVIDNGSDDAPATMVRAQFPHVALLRNARNLGTAHALNQAFRYALDVWDGEPLAERYVFIVSADTVLAPGCVEKLRDALDAHPEATSATGTLLRAFRDPSSEHPFAEAVRSDVVESAGIERRADRAFFLRGAGEIDRAQFGGEPFGAPASFGLFRASALAAIRCGERVADPDVHTQSIGPDLAWRLRLAGGSCLFVPSARAFRFRGVRASADMASRRSQAGAIPASDRWEMILKNETVVALALAAPRLFLSWLVRAWRPAEAWAPFGALLRLPRIWPKRRAAQAARRVSPAAVSSPRT